jgi:uncharacterized protein (DUF924 family)
MVGTVAGVDEILNFWLKETDSKYWYVQNDALDQQIRDRFMTTWEAAAEGRCQGKLGNAQEALAYLIVTDQFPRNMFRDSPKAFETDMLALAAAKQAIDQGFDMKLDEEARQFIYMPLMHSESLCDQERCVRLMCERMPKDGGNNLLHARVHREIIRQFGRFPFRNAALSRSNTAAEEQFFSNGGYGSTLRELEAA